MRLNRFNSIAPYYDRLAALVFGKSIRRAQTHYLDQVSPKARVLVLGGGTGWWLKELQEKNPQCEIWFIEASSEMLAKAKANSIKEMHTIHGTEADIPPLQFDAVITYFFLDLFDDTTIRNVINRIKNSLKADGIWLVSDFRNEKLWHRIMLLLMYSFFRTIGAVQSRRLIDWNKTLLDFRFELRHKKYFFGQFITSCIYRKGVNH